MAAADNGFGLSFSPFGDKQGYGQGDQTSPFQQAIQILSLRRPTIGGAAPVPNALFNAPGLGGMDFNALIQTLMRQFGTGQYRLPNEPRFPLPGGGQVPPITTPPAPTPPAPTSPQLPAPRIDINQNNQNNNPNPGTPAPTLPGPYGAPPLERGPRQA